jgi:hypothetical protein
MSDLDAPPTTQVDSNVSAQEPIIEITEIFTPPSMETSTYHIHPKSPPTTTIDQPHIITTEIQLETITPPEEIVPIVETPESLITEPYDKDFPLHTLVTHPILLLYIITGEKKDILPTKELILDKFTKRSNIDLDKVDKDGNTALHIAVLEKQEQSIQILINSLCNVNIQNLSKDTPLLIAVKKNYTWTTNILCNANVDITICDKDGKSPMEIAVTHMSETDDGECCLPLVSKGADLSLMYKKPIIRKMDDSKYNEFGFLKSDDEEMHQHVKSLKNPSIEKEYEKYVKNRQDLHRKESYRVAKFTRMIKRSKYGALDRKFKNRVIKGVPFSCRGQVYKVLLPIDNLMKSNAGKYDTLCKTSAKHDVLIQIDKDVKRCYRKHKEFSQRFGIYQIRLFNILKAYSLLNKEVEYCQGMSTIAAVLLMFLPEEDAFWGFAHLMAHPNYVIGDLYLPEWPFLLEWYFVFEKLFENFYPKLYKHIDSEGLFTDLYARKWVLCVMLECLPFDVTLRIFDIIVSEGIQILYQVVLGIMKMYETQLLKMKFEEIKIFFQDLCKYPVDEDVLVQFILSNKVQKSVVIKWKAEYVHHAADRKKKHREREYKKKLEMEKIRNQLGTNK